MEHAQQASRMNRRHAWLHAIACIAQQQAAAAADDDDDDGFILSLEENTICMHDHERFPC